MGYSRVSGWTQGSQKLGGHSHRTRVCRGSGRGISKFMTYLRFLSNALALLPNRQPRTRLVGPKLAVMEKRIVELDTVVSKLVSDLFVSEFNNKNSRAPKMSIAETVS